MDEDVEADDEGPARDPAAAGRMGKATEYLVAALAILATGGELNASTSLVDDEGVDLVFHLRGSTTTLAVQVKSRTTYAKRVREGHFQAFVRTQTFSPRPGLALLFVAVDAARGAIIKAWLVPSEDYARAALRPNAQGRVRFVASLGENANDRWRQYRLEPEELPNAIRRRLEQLAAPGSG